MNPTDVLNAAVWVGSAGAVCAVVVQLFRLGIGDTITPRQKVAAATATALLLTLAFGASNAILTLPNLYGLVVAWVTIAAAGAGIQSALTATVTNKPT